MGAAPYLTLGGGFNARLQGELLKDRDLSQRRVAMIIQWAHHMKTPVAVIDLELQKAAKLELPPAPRAVLASIAEENDRLQSLLQRCSTSSASTTSPPTSGRKRWICSPSSGG